jgi:indolepyruvate ferredoxin oxidoreductase alpha subunit
VVYERKKEGREGRVPFTIDRELCNACSLCVRVLGCPAILVEDESYSIDPDLCDGCGLCAHVCRHEAIKVAAEPSRQPEVGGEPA